MLGSIRGRLWWALPWTQNLLWNGPEGRAHDVKGRLRVFLPGCWLMSNSSVCEGERDLELQDPLGVFIGVI